MDKMSAEFSLAPPQLPNNAVTTIANEATKYHPEYTKVTVPALSFYVLYDNPPPMPGDAATAAKAVAAWDKVVYPALREEIERFSKEVKKSRIVELHDTTHTDFVSDPKQQAIVIGEMRTFLEQ